MDSVHHCLETMTDQVWVQVSFKLCFIKFGNRELKTNNFGKRLSAKVYQIWNQRDFETNIFKKMLIWMVFNLCNIAFKEKFGDRFFWIILIPLCLESEYFTWLTLPIILEILLNICIQYWNLLKFLYMKLPILVI